ncbi:hypothetical protein [Cellvibrio sp. PSBB023]|uniref:hypothetical protein n=1 Tax=Cellvibrio sp. PSBB023 TaxID=1945512 RepID=UPI000990140B|nr:hypothetical protein [Cellvibrio sp. PSBB023]AQT61306.1 hypothetical protein B0D95_15215 [Cellvibrio sp. PSBB023]
MEKFIDLLDGGPILNFLFLIIALLSLIFTFIFYTKTKRERKLVYIYKNSPLIKNSLSSINGLSIQYMNKDIDTLTLTRFSIWNQGKETIHNGDIAKSDPLVIKFIDEGIIYSAAILKINNSTNQISIELIDNKIYINFEYLGFGDGLAIDIYHGVKSDRKISVCGTVKGGEKITNAESTHYELTDKVLSFLFPSYWDKEFNEFGFIDKTFIIILLPLAIVIAITLMSVNWVIKGFGMNKPPFYVEGEKF